MKRTQPKPSNTAVIKLFDKVSSHCKSKRVKAVLKHIVKKPEIAMLTSLPGVISHYLDASQATVNILIYQSKKKDIIDHGRWLVLLAYLMDNTDLNINVWINPAQDTEDDVTDLRAVIDFIIDNFHQNKVKTHLVKGTFEELVEHIGMDKLDLIYNHNPTVEDHNTQESISCLHQCIGNGVRYVISDPTPMNLMFKMSIFEIWGVSSRDSVHRNPYYVPIKKGISSQYRYMGYAVSLDTIIDDIPETIDNDTYRILESMADTLVQCANIGEDLTVIPEQREDTINVFGDVHYNVKTSTFTCGHSGDVVSLKLTDVPDFPQEPLSTELSLDVARVSWALLVYAQYSAQFQRHLKRPNLVAV